jgi:hypothetical protein
MIASNAALQAESGSAERSAAFDLLMLTPLDQLDGAVEALLAQRPPEEVRAAMVEVIARAPLAHFETLKRVYLKHCADAAR